MLGIGGIGDLALGQPDGQFTSPAEPSCAEFGWMSAKADFAWALSFVLTVSLSNSALADFSWDVPSQAFMEVW
jgi:hypothetical protein